MITNVSVFLWVYYNQLGFNVFNSGLRLTLDFNCLVKSACLL